MQFRALLLMLILVLCVGCTKEKFTEINRNGYSLSYPTDLVLEDKVDGVEFILFTEKSHAHDTFIENLNLIIQAFGPVEMDLKKYVKISTDQIVEVDGKIVSSEELENDTLNYQRVIYTMTMNGNDLKYLQHYYVLNNKAYILTYTAEEKEYDRYVEEMENIMSPFKVDKAK